MPQASSLVCVRRLMSISLVGIGKIYNTTNRMANKALAKKLCSCIKKVRKTIKVRKGVPNTLASKEKAAIGVCVRSVLQTRGKTLKRFNCGKNMSVTTQKFL